MPGTNVKSQQGRTSLNYWGSRFFFVRDAEIQFFESFFIHPPDFFNITFVPINIGLFFTCELQNNIFSQFRIGLNIQRFTTRIVSNSYTLHYDIRRTFPHFYLLDF